MYNASDRKDIRRAEKSLRRANLDRLEFVRTGMSTAQGRAWFYQLLTSCHIFVVNPPTNPYHTAFSEGERNIGVQIYNDIMSAAPNEYILMIHEAQTRELSNVRSDPDLYTADDDYGPSASPSSEHSPSSPPHRRDQGSSSDIDDDGGWPDNLIGVHDE